MNIYHKRNLPHYYPKGAKFFITFRLFGSIPQEKLEEIQANYEKLLASINKNLSESERFEQMDIAQKRLLIAYDNYLDRNQDELHFLKRNDVADIVKEALLYKDGADYDVLAYCIMSNHVHWVIDTAVQLQGSNEMYKNIDKIMHSIKSYTATKINKLLGRQGTFWQEESFDRVIRHDKELQNILNYTIQNPVKAGIVENWEDFPHSYLKM
jgi:REP element-mobilizing transposase RayT